MKELPKLLIKGRVFWNDDEILKVLLAHENLAVMKMRYKNKTGILGDLSREYWRGYRNAIQALKCEVKK